MHIELERIDGAFGFRARAGQHELLVDASEEVGGQDAGFRPMQLMLVSAAGCSAIDLVSILAKGRHQVGQIRTSVRATRRDQLPRIFDYITLKISIETDAPDAALARALHLTRTKYCSALAVLEASAQIDIVLERISQPNDDATL